MTAVDPATWTRVIEKNGYREYSQGVLIEDPFQMLAVQAKEAPSGPAEVMFGLTNGGDFGQLKVYMHIKMPVFPHEAAISMATEAAFIKVHQMVNEASNAIGLQPLP